MIHKVREYRTWEPIHPNEPYGEPKDFGAIFERIIDDFNRKECCADVETFYNEVSDEDLYQNEDGSWPLEKKSAVIKFRGNIAYISLQVADETVDNLNEGIIWMEYWGDERYMPSVFNKGVRPPLSRSRNSHVPRRRR